MKNKKHLRFCSLAIAFTMLLTAFTFTASAAGEDSETSIDSNALVTYGYLQSILEDLKLELLEELSQNGGNITVGSPYTDVTVTEGTVIVLGSDAEAIFRGGDAVVITVSRNEGAGITDLSAGKECCSGDFLTFGHIYYKTKAESRAYILVTGDKAAFTMKGTYETR